MIVSGLRSDAGRVGCSLFRGPNGFPRDDSAQFRGMWTAKKNGVATCSFPDVPAGVYAATVLDDDNLDGKMDFNWIGMPTKGYGFSRDARATLSPPSFDAASIAYDGRGLKDFPINIVYRTLLP